MRNIVTPCVVGLFFTACLSSGSDAGPAPDPSPVTNPMATGGAGAAGVGPSGGPVGGPGPNGATGPMPPTGSTGATGAGATGANPGAGGATAVGPNPGATGPSPGAGGGGTSGPAGGGASANPPNGGMASDPTGGAPPSGGADVGGSPAGGAGPVEEPFVQPSLVTSTSGAYWVTTGTLTETQGNATVTVDDTSEAQAWEGFGGSFNEKGWDYLLLLGEADRNAALELLFGQDGCNFTFGRIPMGSSDYAMDRYSLDEVPEGETDYEMAQFSIDRDRELLIPYVKAAQAVKSDIHFWASPWSPPTWMKDGPFNDEYAFDGGSMKGDEQTLGALAQYFVEFVQAYGEEAIEIEVVAPQNEPGYSGTYPTCAWAPATYATFVGQHLGPAIAEAGLATRIMLGTFNGGTGDSDIVNTVMGDATASGFIDYVGYQWGMETSVMSAQQYGASIWQTEHKCGNYPWETATFVDDVAPNDHAYAVESWGLVRNWISNGVNAYSVWNMVLDTVGNGIDSTRFWPQNALLTVDVSAQTLNVTPTYYVVRHVSQFVRPGATLLATSGGDALAFKNPDGTIATVMYNSGAATTYTISVAGKTLQFEMPGNGWATVFQ